MLASVLSDNSGPEDETRSAATSTCTQATIVVPPDPSTSHQVSEYAYYMMTTFLHWFRIDAFAGMARAARQPISFFLYEISFSGSRCAAAEPK